MPNDRIKEKQAEILKKAYRICTDNDIKVCLIEETALAFLRDGIINDYPVISIDISDADKLLKAVRNDGRGLLCTGVFNDPRHPVFSIDLYDPDTIDFDSNNYFEKDQCCMKATVRLQRKRYPAKSGRMLTSMIIRFLRSAAAGTFTGVAERKLMRRLGEVYGDAVKDVVVGDHSFKKPLLGNLTIISRSDEEFAVPGDTEKYFETVFGEAWHEHPLRSFAETEDRFRDADHSWTEYRQRLSCIDHEAYSKLQKRYRVLNKSYDQARLRVNAYFILLERTHARIQLWKKYRGVKEEILGLLAQDRTAEAETLLAGYLAALSRFHDKGLGLCFDPDLFEAAYRVLEENGRGAYADELRALIPEEHRQPFKLYDYRGKEITGNYL